MGLKPLFSSMHIVFILPPIERYSPVSGGALSNFTELFSKWLINKKHIVTVIGPKHPDELHKPGNFIGIHGAVKIPGKEYRPLIHKKVITKIRSKLHNWPWPAYDRYLSDVRKNIALIKPDIVFAYNDLDLPYYLKKTNPTLRIFTRLSNEKTRPLSIVSKSIDATEKIICVSEYIKNWMTMMYGKQFESKSIVTINRADSTSFRPRADFLNQTTPIRLLTLGRINHEKGTDLAINTYKILKSRGFSVSLSVAGEDWFYKQQQTTEFEKKIQLMTKDTDINLLGHIRHDLVPQVMRQHDIFLFLPRWNEPLPQTIFEAMASGLAVVSTNVGGIPECMGSAGVLVQSENILQTVGAIEHMITPKDTLAKYKIACRQHALNNPWDLTFQRIFKLFQPVH